jgi:hypothetical protein
METSDLLEKVMSQTVTRVAVNEIVFRDDLYPRIETSATTVQKYAEDLDVLPPIEVNQHRELIDGWHRWTAHKKLGCSEIAATITETSGDTHLLDRTFLFLEVIFESSGQAGYGEAHL